MKKFSEYAVDGDDLSAMSSKTIRGVFRDVEFEELKFVGPQKKG